MVPVTFEYVGSCTHRLRMEPLFDISVISSFDGGKIICPAAAFIARSELETTTLTGKVSPTLNVPECGIKEIDAADAVKGKR